VKKGADVRRGEILVATLELISERGIDALRGADVADRLGVSPALVFYHFENLENLIVSAFRFATERDLVKLEQILAEKGPSTSQRLRGALREYGPTGSAQSWRLWIEGWSAGLRNPTLRAVVRALDTRWRGVSVDTLLESVALDPRAGFATAFSDGGYTTNLRLPDLVNEQAFVAYQYDGAPLEAEHGGPARLVVPHLYFWKSAKWVRGLRLMAEDGPGFWETYGYNMYGDPWREQRYSGD